jgi:hypothetical protein
MFGYINLKVIFTNSFCSSSLHQNYFWTSNYQNGFIIIFINHNYTFHSYCYTFLLKKNIVIVLYFLSNKYVRPQSLIFRRLIGLLSFIHPLVKKKKNHLTHYYLSSSLTLRKLLSYSQQIRIVFY